MEKYYRFAGLELAVTAADTWGYQDDKALTPFRVDGVTDPHRFSFRLVPSLTPPEGQPLAVLNDYIVYGDADAQVRYVNTASNNWQQATMRCVHRGKEHLVELKQQVFPNGMTAKTVLNACAMEHLIARAGGFVLHCSYIEHEGKAVLFTAPSGTGKSTQAELWHSLRSKRIINGDRSVVRVKDGEVLAEGIPFSGSSQICENCSLPLKAIVYLSQAPETTICPLTGVRAFARIWEGVSVNIWDKEDVEQVSATVQQVLERVPVYHLACTPDESAVSALEQMLRKQVLL